MSGIGFLSEEQVKDLLGLEGTNSGDQTSIAGITGTKAEFNGAVTDGDFLFVGDVSAYTDEQARDAIGAALTAGAGITVTPNDGGDTIAIASSITQYTDEMARDALGTALTAGAGISITPNDGGDTIAIASSVTQYTDEMAQDTIGGALTDTATIDFTYNDGAGAITADVKDGSVTYAKMQDVSATDKVLGRSTAGAGDPEEIACTATGRAMIAAATAAAQRTLLRNACMVRKAANQTAVDYSALTTLTWDQEVYDDGGWHDNVTNNTRLSVPSGVDRVRIGCNVTCSAVAAGGGYTLQIKKNGSDDWDGRPATAAQNMPTIGNTFMSISSGQVPVTGGTDYFEAQLIVNGDVSINVVAARSNFWIEAC